MQIMKMLSIFLILVFPLFSRAYIYIYFVNGALNSDREGIKVSADKLFSSIRSEGVVSRGNLFYGRIPIIAKHTNYHEIKFQQKMSSHSISNTFDELSYSSDLVKDLYLIDLGKSYEFQRKSDFPIYGVDNGVVANQAAQIVIARSNGVADIISNHIEKGEQVILIPHSQGNLYVEGALAFLYYRYDNDIVRKNVRVVNLGSVSSLSYNSSWVTVRQDEFIEGPKIGKLLNDGVFELTPSNVSACLLPCTKIASNSELKDVGADSRAHGIKETYTNNNIYSFEKKKSLPSLIVQHVQEAIDILEAPVVTSVNPLVATVGEETVFTVGGSNLTSGMGFAVNDCSPSSVEIVGGTSTKRQFKCTMGQSTGEKNGVIKNRPGGTTAFEFKVQAVLSQVGTWESTISADGFTVKNIFYKNLSALPNGKTVFAGKHTVKYGTSCDLGQDLEVTIDRNGASFGITTVTKSAKTECREGNIHLYTADLGSTTIRDGKLENGILILNRWNGCDSTINNVCYYYDSIKPK